MAEPVRISSIDDMLALLAKLRNCGMNSISDVEIRHLPEVSPRYIDTNGSMYHGQEEEFTFTFKVSR